MSVVDRRVDRLPLLKQAILDARSPAEAKTLQEEFDTIGAEHRATFLQLHKLASGWKWKPETDLFSTDSARVAP